MPTLLLTLLQPALLSLIPRAAAADLSGTVTDADGAPLAGIDVYAYDLRGNYARAATRNGGDWSLTDLPAGSWRLQAHPPDDEDHPDAVERYWPDAPTFCDATPIPLAEGDQRADLDLSLPRSAKLTGRLLDSGAPVPNAYVVCAGGDPSDPVYGVALTDAGGRFTVNGLDSPGDLLSPERVGQAICIFYADGLPDQHPGPTYDQAQTNAYGVLRGTTVDSGDHTLLPGIRVEGTISGPDGPASSGTVFAYSAGQVIATPVLPDGTYAADGLPPGEVVVWAQSDGLATTYWPDQDRPGDRLAILEEGAVFVGVDLSLPAESLLSVALSGDPAEGASLADVSILLYNDDYTVGRGVGADTDGLALLDALHDGPYLLQIFGADAGFTDGWWRGDSADPQIVTVSGLTTLDIALRPGARISGTILDDAGDPVYGAEILAADGDNVFFATSDRDGAYALTGLPPGDYTLSARYAARCPSDPGWTALWWPDARDDDLALPIPLAEGEGHTADLTLSRDDDHDGMGDAWERQHDLDPQRDDSAEDADGDSFTNLEEWLLGTDPSGAAKTGCQGCSAEVDRSGGGARAAGWTVGLIVLALARRRARDRDAAS